MGKKVERATTHLSITPEEKLPPGSNSGGRRGDASTAFAQA